jgi:lauroyl/myristoyl acyltransferase
MNLRHLLSWKGLFYGGLLPAVRRLGPAGGDAVLGACGRLAGLWPARGSALTRGLARARRALRADWDDAAVRPRLAANAWRFLARDCVLQGLADPQVFGLFEQDGVGRLESALAEGRGALVVGSHFGAHLAGLHWLHRRGLPLRLLVQRPKHISAELDRGFDEDGPLPQRDFFLRRDLPPGQCAERLLRARAALRAGLTVYLNGDIPWGGRNARPGRLLGQDHRFLSVWTDLSVLTGAPVFLVFCTHQPRGRFALTVEPLGALRPGEENAAVARYLGRLEAAIAARPDDAPAHLLWPCYGPPAPAAAGGVRRPSRRAAALPAA